MRDFVLLGCGTYFIEGNTIQYNTIQYNTVLIIYDSSLHPLFTHDPLVITEEVYLCLKKPYRLQIQTSPWHLNGFPGGSNIGSTVCRGETHRCAVHLH